MHIVLTKYNVQNERRDNKAVMEVTPGFLAWKVGFKVKSKKSGMEAWTIKSIGGSTAVDTSMSYDATVELVSEEGEETKVLKGATLQQGYIFLSGSEEDEKKQTTHPIMVHIHSIARFERRSRGRPGCVVHYMDKVKNVVAEEYDVIAAMIKEATTPRVPLFQKLGEQPALEQLNTAAAGV